MATPATPCLFAAGGFIEEIDMRKNFRFATKERRGIQAKADSKQIELFLDSK
jgi:hypothetical protein